MMLRIKGCAILTIDISALGQQLYLKSVHTCINLIGMQVYQRHYNYTIYAYPSILQFNFNAYP